MQWPKEVLLLGEEMHCILAYFMWHASWWSKHAEICHLMISNTNQEGIAAYTYKQAHLCMALCSKFDHLWWGSPELASMGVGADNDILDLRMAASAPLLDPLSLAESVTE